MVVKQKKRKEEEKKKKKKKKEEFIIIVNINIVDYIHFATSKKGIETFRYAACFAVNLIVSP